MVNEAEAKRASYCARHNTQKALDSNYYTHSFLASGALRCPLLREAPGPDSSLLPQLQHHVSSRRLSPAEEYAGKKGGDSHSPARQVPIRAYDNGLPLAASELGSSRYLAPPAADENTKNREADCGFMLDSA